MSKSNRSSGNDHGGGDSTRGTSSERTSARARESTDQTDDESTQPADLREKGAEIKQEADELIDGIDAVLEQNAEEFIKNYQQRNGE